MWEKKLTGLSDEITTGYLTDTGQTYYRNSTVLPNQDEWRDTRRKGNAKKREIQNLF
jgi:hypothetical protein